MRSPFPGMDPYLERSDLWPQVHNRLIIAIADALTPQIAPRYRASIEERIYMADEPMEAVGIADVAVIPGQTEPMASPSVATLPKPLVVEVPMPMEIKERFLTLRATQNNEVVSVIEILSPSNKRTGEGRQTYKTKRQQILGSQTSLVEIDLLRGGEPMLVFGPLTETYRILVSRGADRPRAELYSFGLRETIPAFPVPLRYGESEPIVQLQQLLDEVYERARFDLAIAYSAALSPKLSETDADWAKQRLAAIGA
ncbi:MAG: DUF4058 family protein [Synechococcales cyanobacterium RM1_1_8]|nr:DUF4058 family protein [Synechococcales cyanobacterium RM1_1_8]